MRLRSTSPDATRDLGRALAGLLGPGDLLVLAGDLGAGKTTLTQGIAAGLGVDEQVTSPTFTLVRRYDGRAALHHLDVYRLDFTEVVDLGLPELMDGDAVVVIEWGDTISAELGPERLDIVLHYGEGDDERILTVDARGSNWRARTRSLSAALGAWSDAREVDGAC